MRVCLKLLDNNSRIFQYIELAEFYVNSRGIFCSFQMIEEFSKAEFFSAEIGGFYFSDYEML